ncbi:MAG TPA: hypothetical protein VJW76_00925 [Verrucomicrobiae bacterium]|nr:hypothetical protein [Verrucomicrobiae bacterium]
MKRLAVWALVVIGMLLAVAAWDWRRANSLADRARRISIGDSKEQVEKVLGKPNNVFSPPAAGETNAVFLILSVRRETWAYGPKFDLRHSIHSEFPFFWPFKFRLFTPDTNDVRIEFGSSGKVVKVTVPTS